jgi:hypothetical protein
MQLSRTLMRSALAPRQIFRSDFAPEWLGVGAVAVSSAVCAANIGFDLRITWHDGVLLLAAVAVVLATHVLAARRFGLIAEYFALTLAATTAFAVLSYLAMAASGPLVDHELLAADRALGFDWLAGFHWLQAHPAAAKVLQTVYDSLLYQGLYFGVLFGLMDRKTDLREMFWLVFAAGLLTSAGAVLFPALGTFKTFGLEAQGAYLPDMERLRSGHDLHFALSSLTGVVSFPSFHTTMALAYAYGFRRAGAIGWIVGALNLVMLFAIPFFGGHYLVDMIAGAGVMLASLGLVKLAPRLRSQGRVPAAAKGMLAN